MSDEYDRDERPSWRDIDKKRDRSSHVSSGDKTERKDKPPDRWKAGRTKKALELLFQGDKGTIEHEKLYGRMHKLYGTDLFLPTVQKYVEKYGPPDDTSTLILIIDTKDRDIIFLAFDKLLKVYPDASPREKEDIRRKLSIVSMTDKSKEIKLRAADTLEEIKALGA
jgi:hypothetical protein